MSFIQSVLTTIFPKSWGEAMRAESLEWMLRCPCGHERSIWELGGIRWKAAGNPRRWTHCPQCGQQGWHTLYRRRSS